MTLCHSERSEESARNRCRSLASLGMTDLVGAKSLYRIDSTGSARGEPAGEERNRREQCGNEREDGGIGRRNAVELSLDVLRGGSGDAEASDDAEADRLHP